MQRAVIYLRKATEPWITKAFFMVKGQEPPKGWEYIPEDNNCKEQFYASGVTHSQPIFAKRPS